MPAGVLEDLYRRCGATRPVTGPPSKATIWRVVTGADAAALDAVIGAWLMERARAAGDLVSTGHGRDDAPLIPVRVDGKTVRGARNADGSQVHLLASFAGVRGVVAAQAEVGAKTNEIPMIIPLLDGLDLDGAVVTADALHTQRATAPPEVAAAAKDRCSPAARWRWASAARGSAPRELVRVRFEHGRTQRQRGIVAVGDTVGPSWSASCAASASRPAARKARMACSATAGSGYDVRSGRAAAQGAALSSLVAPIAHLSGSGFQYCSVRRLSAHDQPIGWRVLTSTAGSSRRYP